MTSIGGAIGVHGASESLGGTRNLARARTFHTLDALRGVAAMSVLLVHAAFFYGIAKPAEGQLAVDLFFVMSGFIVAHRYEPALRRDMSFAQFVRIRLVRLYPLFLLGMVLGVIPALIVKLMGHADSLHDGLVGSLAGAVFMLPSRLALPTISELYPLNYVAWSLALELAINIAYATSFRLWTIRNLTILIAFAFVALAFCAAATGRLDGGYAWHEGYVGIARVLYGFPVGVLLCRLYERKPFTWVFPWWLPLLLAGAFFVLGAQRAQAPWELFAITIVMPLVVAAAIASEPPKALHRSCAFIGLMSYPLYSLHAPFIGLFMRGESLLHVDPAVVTRTETLVFTASLAGLCLAAQFLYDSPVRRFLTPRPASA